MKTLTLIAGLLLFFTTTLHAQLKYERTVDLKYKTIKIDDGTFKYYKYNKDDKKVLVYKMDNTLWRTINLPLPKNHRLDEIKNISVHTFNDDDLVELVYSCVVYNLSDNLEDPDKEYVQIEFTLNIINETGDMILRVPNSNEMEILDSEGQKKLLIYKHVGEHMDNENETIVYSL